MLSRLQEKEMALNMAVDAFCKLAKQHTDIAQLVKMYLFFLSFYLCFFFFEVFILCLLRLAL